MTAITTLLRSPAVRHTKSVEFDPPLDIEIQTSRTPKLTPYYDHCATGLLLCKKQHERDYPEAQNISRAEAREEVCPSVP